MTSHWSSAPSLEIQWRSLRPFYGVCTGFDRYNKNCALCGINGLQSPLKLTVVTGYHLFSKSLPMHGTLSGFVRFSQTNEGYRRSKLAMFIYGAGLQLEQ